MRGKLILVTGSPCVGKTAAARRLFESLENSAYFDGDWAWCVNPFSTEDPRLRVGDKTMSYALSTYLSAGFRYVIFSSVVIIGEEIRRGILNDITARGYDTLAFTLKCGEETLAARRLARGDEGEISYEWLRMPPHPGDIVLYTDGDTPEQTAAKMREIITAGE